VTARAASIVIGDPMAEETELGPLAFQAQLDKVSEYVGIGVAEGGRIADGGGRPEVDLPGYFFQPTVLTDTTNDMRITQE
ncbi:aldehyde dehydrogenase family protein, partial [Mycobacterium tuberculosis]|nr:aldehyde dehydrogenase family protein [Mycobacterium tuberculosis]